MSAPRIKVESVRHMLRPLSVRFSSSPLQIVLCIMRTPLVLLVLSSLGTALVRRAAHMAPSRKVMSAVFMGVRRPLVVTNAHRLGIGLQKPWGREISRRPQGKLFSELALAPMGVATNHR